MKKTLLIVALILIGFVVYYSSKKVNTNPSYSVGQPIDSLNHVIVYFNGGVGNVEERNVVDGYNVGLKYQCVEFVKRYYLEHYNHKMPDSYGNAKDFFVHGVSDGEFNTQRGLKQYSNPSSKKPEIGDLIVMAETTFNEYGHVAIVSQVLEDQIEIIQQNPGPFSSSRVKFNLVKEDAGWVIENDRILGWLRKL